MTEQWNRILHDLSLQARLHGRPLRRFVLARMRTVLQGREFEEGRLALQAALRRGARG